LKAGVIGATGYAGAELVRLLAGHPNIDELILSSVSYEGERIEGVYQNFMGKVSAPLKKAEDVVARADVVFASLPHGVGEAYAAACVEKGKPFIDLSADFRFGADEAGFSAWYGKTYQRPELRQHSVYGMPEVNRRDIKALAATGKCVIGNPGCYPTAATLGCQPALAKGLAGTGTVIVDAASGVTGGGREPNRAYHFPECSDSMSAYKVGAHRHTPEISRNLAVIAGRDVPLIFTPHLAPMNRGILATIYIPLADAWRAVAGLTGEVGVTNVGVSGEAGVTNVGVSGATGATNVGVSGEAGVTNVGVSGEAGATNVGVRAACAVNESAKIGVYCAAPRPPTKEIETKAREIHAVYADFYKDEPFVRVLPFGSVAATGRVRQSNFCDISVHLDQTGATLIIEAAIDNMVKGAAGQAVQNMNIVCGFEESAGLGTIPALF
jgi:N-acetyl-gamma-glutamyl-phosphate reductase